MGGWQGCPVPVFMGSTEAWDTLATLGISEHDVGKCKYNPYVQLSLSLVSLIWRGMVTSCFSSPCGAFTNIQDQIKETQANGQLNDGVELRIQRLSKDVRVNIKLQHDCRGVTVPLAPGSARLYCCHIQKLAQMMLAMTGALLLVFLVLFFLQL